MIRPAQAEDAPLLTRISFESKSYWGYPKEYFEIWKPELTITTDYISKHTVFLFEKARVITGYYSIVELRHDLRLPGITLNKGHWLEHMFIAPGHIGHGMGSELFTHARRLCETRGIAQLRILADPHARGFYEKMGCRYQGEYPSTIAGRSTPLLVLETTC
jgi:GNAT superfamily N-acetyltransferase